MILQKFNAILSGCSGVCGDVAVRQYKGKTIVCKRPPQRGKSTNPAQKATNNKFKLANEYATVALANPGVKAMYTRAAQQSAKLVHARNMAVSDYFNPPQIQKIGTALYTGKPGDRITILAQDDIEVSRVTVAIYDNHNQLVETGLAVSRKLDKSYDVFDYYTTCNEKGCRIVVTAADHPGNVVVEEVYITTIAQACDSPAPSALPTAEECDATAVEEDLLRPAHTHSHYFNISPKVLLNKHLAVKPGGNFAFYTQEHKTNRYEKDRHMDDGRRDVGVGSLLQQYESYFFVERQQCEPAEYG